LPREEWEAQLHFYKCKKVTGLGRLNTAEWWRAQWNFLFTVPIEDDGSCHQDQFKRLIINVLSTAPQDIRFDE
jgi:hypothetical protein